jgi:hypothetical protein
MPCRRGDERGLRNAEKSHTPQNEMAEKVFVRNTADDFSGDLPGS